MLTSIDDEIDLATVLRLRVGCSLAL